MDPSPIFNKDQLAGDLPLVILLSPKVLVIMFPKEKNNVGKFWEEKLTWAKSFLINHNGKELKKNVYMHN